MNKKLVNLVHLEMEREQLKELAVQCFNGSDRERGFLCGFDVKGTPIYIEQVAVGSLNCVYLSMRDLFKGLLLSNSYACAFFHNHLTEGKIQISQADWAFTKHMKRASDLLGIEFLDHLIINLDGEYVSVLEKVLEEEAFLNE